MSRPKRSLAIVTPVLDDWISLRKLAERLHAVLDASGWTPMVVAIDDGSREPAEAGLTSGAEIIVHLARNVGHQRAIAIGIDYVLREFQADTIVVMDADGEDRPEDLPELLSAMIAHPGRIIVAERRRRSEGTRFSALYFAYKATFRITTGEHLNFGNFSVLDRGIAVRLNAMHELWLSYPAALMRSRIEIVRVPTDRGHRIAGESRMNLVGLVVHGLSAVGVFSERVFTRTLVAVCSLGAVLAAGLIVGLGLKVVGLATPGWVTTIAAALVIVLIQSAMVALCGLFVVFGNTTNVVMSPAAIARSLVASVDVAPDRAASQPEPPQMTPAQVAG